MTSGSTSGIASGLSSSNVSFRSQGIPSLSSLDSLGQEGDCNLLGSVEDNLTPDSLSADWYFWAAMSKDKFMVGTDCPNNTQYTPSDVLASTGFSHSLSLRNPDTAEAKTESKQIS
ncbi:unnamed protein product [Dibothriocephalus latus]|uniref:Uncharacterized protein n=1 Tax=Dibothriocephalus latus TaxID=60516 RepID=A0A3P7LXZ2_DIBLA|nr:unnamed protein product [Dibothriocephalus latus]